MTKGHLHIEVEQLSEGSALPLELVWRYSDWSRIGLFVFAALLLVAAFILGDMIPSISRIKHLFAGWRPLLTDADTCVQRSLPRTDRR